MANLDDQGDEGVSLFPMFNILACTLGVMVFVLATVATVSLGADKAVEFEVVAELSQEFRGRAPTWIEWDGVRLIVHPEGASVTLERDLRAIPTFEQTYDYLYSAVSGTRVGAVLAEVSVDPRRYVVLMVRPTGFRTLPEISGYLDLLAIDVVQEPIDQSLRRIQVR